MKVLIVVVFFAVVLGQIKHVHLVDQIAKNYLFRGGAPEVNGVFSYAALTTALSYAAKTVNVTLPPPSSYELVVINVEDLDTSFPDYPEDGTNVLSEHAFFANNTNAGSFIFWHMRGTNAHANDSKFNGQLGWLSQSYPEWGGDRLVSRVQSVRSLLQQQGTRPRVIYLHCDCGCDRTGQTMGAYAMLYQNKTWDQVCAWNFAIAGRPQTCPTHRQMQWYCLYLNMGLQMKSTGNCLNSHLCTPTP